MTRAVFAGNKLTSLPRAIKNWKSMTHFEVDGLNIYLIFWF